MVKRATERTENVRATTHTTHVGNCTINGFRVKPAVPRTDLFNFPATPVPSTLDSYLRALRNLMCGVVDLPVPGLRATSHSGNDSRESVL